MNFKNLSKIFQAEPNKVYNERGLKFNFYENYSHFVICLVEFRGETLFIFPVVNITEVKDINIQQIKEQTALLASEEMYVHDKHVMVIKSPCKRILSKLIEGGISENIQNKINKLEKLHKDEIKEFEDNKFKVLQDLTNRGLEVKFSNDEKYKDTYEFELKDGTISVSVVTEYPSNRAINGSSTEYQIYNANDIIALLEMKLGRPLMKEDFIGEVLDTIDKKPN